jgi:hypothetical protein
MVAGDRQRLLNAAKGESDPQLRRDAIHQLGVMGANVELSQLYAGESSVEVREAIMHAMFVSGNTDKLIEFAKSEKEPKLRRQAIHMLGNSRKVPGATDALASLYGSESDREVKKQILHSLFIQNNATKIIELARAERDPELKRDAVQKLSNMKSKEATDFMMEILK